MQNNQKGAASIILVIILIVAILAFGVWYIWENNKKQNDESNLNQEQTSQQADSETQQQYLTIDEWGVRIPLSAGIEGVYYEFGTDGAGDVAYIYDANFDSLENVNGVPCGGDNKYAIFAISRATPEAVSNMEIELEKNAFESVSFTDEYLFSGIGAHQAPPYCAMLDPQTSGEAEYDQNILDIAHQKEAALSEAYEDLQLAN